MNRTIMIVTAVLGLGAAVYGQDKDIAAWQTAMNKAQAVTALQQERELAVKQGVADYLDLDKKLVGVLNVNIFGNEIRISAKYGNKWTQPHLNAFAKEIAYFALMLDSVGAEKSESKLSLYQYFHVVLDDSERIAGEAIVNRADYPTIDALSTALSEAPE